MKEVTDKSAVRFVGLLAMILWLGVVAVLAVLYADHGFVSVPQLIAADVVAEVRVEQSDSTAGFRGEVLAVYKGDVTPGQRIVVRGVSESALSSLRSGQVWIVPLTRAGKVYQVTRYPLRAPARIYRALPQVRRQIEWAVQQAVGNRL